ncbi:hypothetical protein C1646_771719 [Rhizophagus diaphanus]|nr:hypothetical protein C1646_771719 [Rhizophagus diaphanus] [Rhizophagus sp. MUCL 43196]
MAKKVLAATKCQQDRQDHETPEICIHDPFRKILKENPRILSKNGYITMYGKLYENDKDHGLPSNYIYCNIYDSLVFISKNGRKKDKWHQYYMILIVIQLAMKDMQVKVTIAKNTMPSVPNFKSACNSNVGQKMPDVLMQYSASTSEISSRTSLDDLTKAYFEKMQEKNRLNIF